jgi:hypothetical protein
MIISRPQPWGERRVLGQLKQQGSSMFGSRIGMLVCAGLCAVIFIATDYQPPLDTTFLETSLTSLGATLLSASSSFNAEENAKEMKEWRETTEKGCQEILDTNKKIYEQKEALEISAISKYTVPDVRTLSGKLPSGHVKYEYCLNTFIDLGTNIGDSIGYFVDNSIDPCTPLWMKKLPKTKMNKDFPRPHLDVTETKIYNKGFGSNPLFGMLQKAMTEDPNNIVFPENTCVYGMEGNPAFTERLQKLENFVMGMKPRPVRHLHIHTESVVTAVDGPTKLFLDKTSVKENVSRMNAWLVMLPSSSFTFLHFLCLV